MKKHLLQVMLLVVLLSHVLCLAGCGIDSSTANLFLRQREGLFSNNHHELQKETH